MFEKGKPGGQFNLAPLTPNKRSMEKLVPYFTGELERKGIPIRNKEATAEDLTDHYDGIVLATGSVPIIPPVEGLKKYYWAEILQQENLPENKNVLIIGGGLIGVDIATALIPRGNRVTIVKRTTDFGGDMEMISKKLSLKIMKENDTAFSDHTNINKVDGKTVYAERHGEEIRFDDIDIIIVSAGMKSYRPLEEELAGDEPIYIVGDAKKTGDAQDAIADAYARAAEI